MSDSASSQTTAQQEPLSSSDDPPAVADENLAQEALDLMDKMHAEAEEYTDIINTTDPNIYFRESWQGNVPLAGIRVLWGLPKCGYEAEAEREKVYRQHMQMLAWRQTGLELIVLLATTQLVLRNVDELMERARLPLVILKFRLNTQGILDLRVFDARLSFAQHHADTWAEMRRNEHIKVIHYDLEKPWKIQEGQHSEEKKDWLEIWKKVEKEWTENPRKEKMWIWKKAKWDELIVGQ
ncbi:hypothetical protein QBC38DRAFT_439981 [Podospora fimiseda]|uniref:Uncharacterized protein n=1 Tax=Podospora fimiseda TaxID=252190 RepID=A0AAN7H7V5_9PEZI|nr:hypothetical protein QBC38DRAFT_439981 [Podospora fimiseda]